MKPRTIQHLFQLVLLPLAAATWAGTAHAEKWLDKRGRAPVHGDAAAGQAKSEVCRACHGQDGNTPVPTFPNLGGQHADYLYWELFELKHGYRYQSPMTEQLAPLGDQDVRDLAAFFASQALAHTANATPPDAAAQALATGIFARGDVATGVPPCQACHGPTGEGITQRPGWPILQGQHAAYIAARLRAYRDGEPPDSSNDLIMAGVARGLDDAMIDAIAGWLAVQSGGPGG